MDGLQPGVSGQEGTALDPPHQPLDPAPDYGTLGPGSDIPLQPVPASLDSRERLVSNSRLLHAAAMLAGIGLALAVAAAGGTGAVWGKLSAPFSPRKNAGISSTPLSDRDLDRQNPQKQAEILLERAVARSDGATAQIEARVNSWRGQLKWDARLGELSTAALNSNDRRVQDSAIEVQLAAYGLAKNDSNVDALVRQASSSDHSQKIWAFWTLALLANRGLETDRVVQMLSAHLKDSDRGSDKNSEDTRRWAVESLAVVGTNSTIVPLLEAMHDDPSPIVRERAACSLAESGMLTHDQRLIAVPQLIIYSDDPALDAQTRAWAFQALGDITQQRLPNDSAAWRNWYQNNSANN